MANSISTQPWTLKMDAGAEQQWLFTFTTGAPGGTTPWPISGATWEYVARTSATDLTVPPLIKITTTPSSAGLLTVTSSDTMSSVQLDMYPAATVSLTPWARFIATLCGSIPVPQRRRRSSTGCC